MVTANMRVENLLSVLMIDCHFVAQLAFFFYYTFVCGVGWGVGGCARYHHWQIGLTVAVI